MDDIEKCQDDAINAPVLADPPTLPINNNISNEEGRLLYEKLMADNSIRALDMVLCVGSPLFYLVDYLWDIYTAVQFYWAGMMTEFFWTLAFVFVPGFIITVNTRIRCAETKRKEYTWRKVLMAIILILQMVPLMHAIDALIYARDSRRAAREGNHEANFKYYLAKRRADKEVAPLRLFECFMEAAPQLILQITLLMRRTDDVAVFQKVKICLSAAALVPAILMIVRNYLLEMQDLKLTWPNTLQISLGHYLVTLSRVFSIATIACLFPSWTILSCCLHILTMAICLMLYRQNEMSRVNTIAQIFFSFIFGAVFLFISILPITGKNKSWNIAYYAFCISQNLTCCIIWYVYASDDMSQSRLYHLIFWLSIVPYCIGINLMYFSMFCQCSIRSMIHNDMIDEITPPQLEKMKTLLKENLAEAFRRQFEKYGHASVSKADLEVVILNRDKALSEIESTTLRKAIEDKLVDYEHLPNGDSDQPTNCPAFKIFPKRVYTGLKFICSDESSLSWLNRAVDFHEDLWEGCEKFRVVPVNQLSRYQIGIIFFPDFAKDVTILRKLLQNQNGAYDIYWWPLFKHDKNIKIGSKEINHVLVFGIPTKDAEILRANNNCLNFSLATVRVFLMEELGERGLMDTPEDIQTDSATDIAAAYSPSDEISNAELVAAILADNARNIPKLILGNPDTDEEQLQIQLHNEGEAALLALLDPVHLEHGLIEISEDIQTASDNDMAAASCSASDKLINTEPAAGPVADTPKLPSKITSGNPDYDEEQLLLDYLSSGKGKKANLKGLNDARDQRLFVP